MKRAAFICLNHTNVYSGGRMHALMLACAFARNGYKVDFFTNAIPVFAKEVDDMFDSVTLNFVTNEYCFWTISKHHYSHIVFAPHLVKHTWTDYVDNLLVYPFIKRLKKHSKAKLWVIDFESPNWICDLGLRDYKNYKNLIKLSPYIDIVLSTTKTGVEYSRVFYSKYNPNVRIEQLYLAVNSKVADNIGFRTNKENQVIVFYRSGQIHKNNKAIFDIAKGLPPFFKLIMIGKISSKDKDFLDQLREECNKLNIVLEVFSNISEIDKFGLLSKSKILFFNSSFEGYGLPPIEAQYVGTPVICNALPVLIEVNRNARFVDFSNPLDLKNAISEVLAKPINPQQLHDEVQSFASISHFCSNLNIILNNI